ncbi:MAG: molybdenum cofactor biosynthesis protein MoaE [Bacteroidota bacterium]
MDSSPLPTHAKKDDRTWVALTHERLDLAAVSNFLYHPRAGGVDIFSGTTRQWTGSGETAKETVELSYECYEMMAIQEMQALLDEAIGKWPVVRGCLLHRLGIVPVAEASVVIGIATPHRGDAFEACRFLIDQLKIQVPIWKKEHYSDGKKEWVMGKGKPEVK